MPTTIAIIIGGLIGVLLSSIGWGIFASHLNNEWADFCREINRNKGEGE